MNAFIKFAENYWWLLFIFGGMIASFLEGVRDFFLSLAQIAAGRQKITEIHHHHDEAELPAPGPCKHRQVKQVRDRNDELVAWLCTTCDAQLPADWAVAREDL